MKLLNFRRRDDQVIRLGILTDDGIIDVKSACYKFNLEAPFTMGQAIEQGNGGLAKLRPLLDKQLTLIPEDEITFAPAVTDPGKIICIGVNYRQHAIETSLDIPTFPVIFSKFNNTIAAHKEPVPIPKTTKKCDYEAELVIVIGKEAKNVSKEDALSYVFGYTAGNDFSARDLQFLSSQWLIGKTCDAFAPIGPFLKTADDFDPTQVDISCYVNEELRQQSNTKHMIFSCADIISTLSHYMVLQPGDIVFTGTPDGVIMGYPLSEQIWLKPGDKVCVTIENLGTLCNIMY